MHMADALVSPAVGLTMTAVSAGLLAHSARRVARAADDRLVPLMGVTGAFVFAGQMLNFTIPLTGSSGHIGGGLLLAALLGPHAAFVALAAVLAVQALLFADGGLLAYGCNLFNLGFWPCFVIYPLLWRPLAQAGRWRGLATVLGVVLGLQLGALGVVLQTKLSGITALPFVHFLLLMQPIHLAIGLVEGLATAAVLALIYRARPELLTGASLTGSVRPVLVGLLLAAMFCGGLVAWFASGHPDGLEWAMERTAGTAELDSAGTLHAAAGMAQERVALMPDYAFPAGEAAAAEAVPAWPAVDPGTTVAGLLGALVTLLVAGGAAYLLRRKAPATA